MDLLVRSMRTLAETVPARIVLLGSLALTTSAGLLALLVRSEATVVIFVFVAALAALQGATVATVRLAPDEEPPALRERIELLGSSLADAAEAIESIEIEIKARQQLVEQLEHDARVNEELVRLHRTEVEAVAQALRAELAREGRKAMRLGLAQNGFFFVLGVIASVVVGLLIGP
jgi:membrane protein implicated in regulation of membrane protease activity